MTDRQAPRPTTPFPAITDRTESFMPEAYRQVSFQAYGGVMREGELRRHLLGKEAYRTTRFIVLHGAAGHALVEVLKEDDTSLFSPITRVSIVALPPRCHFHHDPDLDSGNPTALAERAHDLGLGEHDTLVACGRDSHVSFIHRPKALRLRIFDVVPPEPSKLERVAKEVLAYTHLPASRLDVTVVDTRDLLSAAERAGDEAARTAEDVLVPCRASGLDFDRPTHFLDERPPRGDWTLLGCERSRQIHRHFYGDVPPRIETCPRRLLAEGGSPCLLRCCLLEDSVDLEPDRAVVPWGAPRRAVETALEHLTRAALKDPGCDDPSRGAT